MTNCLFCKIINGDIPSVKIFENNDIIAFLDISQVTKGHTLVIPKHHYENVFQLDGDTIASIFRPIPKIAEAIKSAFNANGINIINNNGEVAGQTIFHYHVHIVPRYNEDDGFRAIYTNHMDKYSREDLVEFAKRITDNIKD
ncbi:MAG: hypothetical protein K0Q49_2555 [Haloplasmataceae bacterium]|jgi:histidine triad (HIT) family protein|nr:hypothetical protein [Haloplasmataceae bacterium]